MLSATLFLFVRYGYSSKFEISVFQVFASIKGFYFQADIHNTLVTWMMPFDLVHKVSCYSTLRAKRFVIWCF